ncbi:MAG: translation elongation factor-like protein [Candidatus Micrarchaeota archaeon]
MVRMPKTVIGKVSHFFGKIGVAALSLSGELKIGDRIRFEHKDGSLVLEDTVRSMQIQHKEVTSAGPGDDVAIKLSGSVHEGNIVYRVTE